MQWIVQLFSPILIRWIVIYPVDSAIRRLNNRGLNVWNRLSRDKCSMSRNIQITEQKDQYIWVACSWRSDSRARVKSWREKKKQMGDLREKSGSREPSFSLQSPLVFSRVRFNAHPHHLNSALYYLNAWSRQTDERMTAFNLGVSTMSLRIYSIKHRGVY